MTKTRILIVDDEKYLLEELAKTAALEGYEALTASDGEEGLRLARAQKFDIMVTDLKMPGMDGKELMKLVAGLPHPPRVIAITGYASLAAAVDCLRAGAADFLVKPFENADFLDALRRVETTCGKGRAADWPALSQRYGLTRRESEILALFCNTGKSNKDMADDLFLSEHTVKSHLSAAMRKVGVDSRAQLLAAAYAC